MNSAEPDNRGAPASESIAEALRALILEGSLGPDARLPGEQELAQRFGVSRPTLREALKRLAAQNLIRTRRGAAGGTFVNRVGWEEAREQLAATTTLLVSTTPIDAEPLAEARLTLLLACAPLACARRREAHLAALQAEIAFAEAPDTDDRAFCASDVRFHRVLGEATDNPLLALHLAGAVEAVQPLLNMLSYRMRDRAAILVRHRAIAERLEARDSAGMATELEALAAYTLALVREAQKLRAARRTPKAGDAD
ncbi:MAG: GntR family transcriptional regulator [Pseudomonadota bacterium]